MNKRKRILLCILMIAVLIPALLSSVSATEEPTLNSKHAILYNIEYNSLIYSKGCDDEIFPASFTKIMTAILAFEYKESHADIPAVSASEAVLKQSAGTTIDLQADEIMSFDDLLAAVVVGGANDAALVIADMVGGGVDGFVEMMNEKASELGCENTYFANPTGLHTPLMKTTMRDLLKICICAYGINDFMELSSKFEYTIPATNKTDARELFSRNYLLNSGSNTGYFYDQAKGMNAGSTEQAGYCLASTHRSGGLTALAIVSGAELIDNRYQSYIDVSTLFDYFGTNYTLKNILEKGRIICEIPIELGSDIDHLILVAGKTVQYIVPGDYNDSDTEIIESVDAESATAPVSQGDVFGEIQVLYKGNLIGTSELVAQSSVSRSPVALVFSVIGDFFSNTVVKIICFTILGVFLFIVLIMIITLFRNSRKRYAQMTELEKEYYKDLKIKNKEYDEFRRARRKSLFHSLTKPAPNTYKKSPKSTLNKGKPPVHQTHPSKKPRRDMPSVRKTQSERTDNKRTPDNTMPQARGSHYRRPKQK